jgi:hypothetical protein
MYLANWKLTRRYGNLLGEVTIALYRISVIRKNWGSNKRHLFMSAEQGILSSSFCHFFFSF